MATTLGAGFRWRRHLLDAQREACEAFILSQRQEGWRVLPTRYDDGGYSGGNMARPALQRLLQDVTGKKVSTVVVYKVDRLTRSLADFAKIVESLDAEGVSFVSVTQQFNTTSSMGRLTLNALLSFAQFEREVTGERIRDKIAASKRKGMWMGGMVPLGFDLRARKLVPNPKEAELVRKIFALYLELRCVSKLQTRLGRENIRSKVWTSQGGTPIGGASFSRVALYDLLRNRIYIGEIRHRDQWYPGEQEGIVALEVWDQVQAQLSSNSRLVGHRLKERSSSLLTGMIEDEEGNRFTPSFTVKNGKRYRYYVSQLAIKHAGSQSPGPIRLPAHEVERQVTERLRSFLRSDADVLDEVSTAADDAAGIQRFGAAAKKLAAKWPTLCSAQLRDLLASFISRVAIHENKIQIVISRRQLRRVLEQGHEFISAGVEGPCETVDVSDQICLTIEAKLKRCGGEVRMVVPPNSRTSELRSPRPSLIKAIARANSWYQKILDGKATDQGSLARQIGVTDRYVARVFGCAFLAPDIVEAILEGRQPHDLNLQKLCKNVPLSWVDQRKQFGFPPQSSR